MSLAELRDRTPENTTATLSVREALSRARTQNGTDLLSLSAKRPLLLVFLRHFGCTFCREAVADVAARRTDLESAGARVVFVHMGTAAEADRFFAEHGVPEIDRVSDPVRTLYRAFELRRGNWRDLLDPRTLRRGIAALWKGHGVGRIAGDPFQMPGAFLVADGRIARAYRHAHPGDRPDYCTLVALEVKSSTTNDV